MINSPNTAEKARKVDPLAVLKKNVKTLDALRTTLQSEWTDEKMIASVVDIRLVNTIQSARDERATAANELKEIFKNKPQLPLTEKVQVINTATFRDVSPLDKYDKFAEIKLDGAQDIVAEADRASRMGESLQTYNDDAVRNRITDIPDDKMRQAGLRWQQDVLEKISKVKDANTKYGSALRDAIQALLPERMRGSMGGLVIPSHQLLKVRGKILSPLRDLRTTLLNATGYNEETMRNEACVFRDLAEENLDKLIKAGTPAAQGNIIAVLDNLIELAQSADAKSEPNPFDYNPDLYDDGPVDPKAAETPQGAVKPMQKVTKTRTGIRRLFNWGNKQ